MWAWENRDRQTLRARDRASDLDRAVDADRNIRHPGPRVRCIQKALRAGLEIEEPALIEMVSELMLLFDHSQAASDAVFIAVCKPGYWESFHSVRASGLDESLRAWRCGCATAKARFGIRQTLAEIERVRDPVLSRLSCIGFSLWRQFSSKRRCSLSKYPFNH